jgi:hypothetical protein
MKAFKPMELTSAVAVAAVVTALLIAWFAGTVNDSAQRGQAAAAARPYSSAMVSGDGAKLVIVAERLPRGRSGASLPKSAKAATLPSD